MHVMSLLFNFQCYSSHFVMFSYISWNPWGYRHEKMAVVCFPWERIAFHPVTKGSVATVSVFEARASPAALHVNLLCNALCISFVANMFAHIPEAEWLIHRHQLPGISHFKVRPSCCTAHIVILKVWHNILLLILLSFNSMCVHMLLDTTFHKCSRCLYRECCSVAL